MNEATKSSVKPDARTTRRTPSGRTRAARCPGGQLLGKQSSGDAARRAAVVLEVLAGERTPQQGAAALCVSTNYYYLLERQALSGLLRACEVRPKGRGRPGPERKLAKLETELARCQRECQRQAALVRATQRAVGIPATPPAPAAVKRSSKNGPQRRRRRPVARALAAAKTLRQNSTGQEVASGVQTESLEAARPVASALNQVGMDTREGDGA
jgi:hypothetical protein